MEFGFFRGLPENLFILDIVGQIAFLLDIIFQFFVSYRDPQTYRMVYKRGPIALRYLKSHFIIDLLCCMPWDIIYKASGHKEEVRYLLWIRLWRVRRVTDFFYRMEKDIRINYLFTRIIKLIAVELYCTHTAACIFYYLATTLPPANEGYTWIGSLKMGDYSYAQFRDIEIWTRYTTSLYFAIVTMATVGYGDIHAVNLREMIFVMIYVSFDMILGAYLIGNMTALIVKGSKTEKYRDKMTDLIKYMNRNRLGRDIRNQIKGHLRLQYERSYTEASVLQDIPISIRAKISETLYLPIVEKVSLFKGCSSEFINQIAVRLHEEFFLPGELILEQGSVVDQLYFVCQGALAKEAPLRDKQLESDITFHIGKQEAELALRVNSAAYHGDLSQLKGYIRAGADPNRTDYDGRSPLHLAASRGYEDMARFLVQKGVDVNIRDKFGNTPLMEAIKSGHDRVASLLVGKGASLNIEDAGSFLCTSVARGDSDFLKRILANGVDPNSKDYDHRTPLHVAASEGLFLMAKLLVEAGASVFTKDRWGNTPLDEGRKCGNKNLIKLLEEAKTTQLAEMPDSKDSIGKLNSRKCTVFAFHPWCPKEERRVGIVLWIPQSIEELIEAASELLEFRGDDDDDRCVVTEDGGRVVDVDMIDDGQKMYLINNQSRHG
ncbi:Potassium channel SKOR [Linum perenne]